MERFCATLCNALVGQGRPCTLVAMHPAAAEGGHDWLDKAVDYVELNRPARYTARKLARLCRANPDDPVLALGVEICAVLVVLKRVGLIRNPVVYRESTAVLAHSTRFWKWVIRRFVSGADGLIVQSRQALADLGQLFEVRQPVGLIRNPCALLGLGDAGGCRLPSAGQPLRLLSVGRLDGMKGHERLLDAMPGLLRRFPGVRLCIAGKGALEEQLKEKSRKMGLQDCVAWLGFVQDTERLYREADIFVLPSFYEGLPNVLIEALAMGCPVIAAAGEGGTRELMEELGLGQFLVEGDFVGRLPDAVERVLASAPEVWAAARGRLAKMVRPAAVADQVWAFLEEVSPNEPN
jgi:glycosyltransferase involved in cell wall biosynthesis